MGYFSKNHFVSDLELNFIISLDFLNLELYRIWKCY